MMVNYNNFELIRNLVIQDGSEQQLDRQNLLNGMKEMIDLTENEIALICMMTYYPDRIKMNPTVLDVNI